MPRWGHSCTPGVRRDGKAVLKTGKLGNSEIGNRRDRPALPARGVAGRPRRKLRPWGAGNLGNWDGRAPLGTQQEDWEAGWLGRWRLTAHPLHWAPAPRRANCPSHDPERANLGKNYQKKTKKWQKKSRDDVNPGTRKKYKKMAQRIT